MTGKIVLVKPANLFGYSAYPPLGLLAVGTVLQNEGYTVKIINAAVERDYKNKLYSECREALLVGITCCTSELASAIKIIDFVKERFAVPIVLGGWHPTLFPTQTCEDSKVSFVIEGEGDYALLELANCLSRRGNLQDVRGLVYKQKGEVIVNEYSNSLDVEELPIVNYNLMDISHYSASRLNDYFSKAEKSWLPYQSSRGCPHRCAFCINAVTDNRKWRPKSSKKVIEEIGIIVEKHNLDHIRIIDDNFFVDLTRVKEICEGLIDSGINITWDAECRVDYFQEGKLNYDLLNLCTQSGLVELTLGCESGSQRVLDYMKKDIQVADSINAVWRCNKHNIVPRCSFMTGTLGESVKESLQTADLIRFLRKIAPKMATGIATFRPYPRSEMCKEIEEVGLLKEPDSLRGWITKKQIRQYTERTYRQPWQTEPAFTEKLSFYFCLAGGILLSNNQIRYKLLRRVNTFFIKLALWRTENSVFGFPVDMHFYNFFHRAYFKFDTYLKRRG